MCLRRSTMYELLVWMWWRNKSAVFYFLFETKKKIINKNLMFYEKHFNWEKLANGKTTCRTFAPIQRPSYCPARESAPIRQWVKNTFFSREIRVLLPLEGEHRKKDTKKAPKLKKEQNNS